MILDLATFTQHASACAPAVHVETLAAIARTESRFNTLAIGDNTTKRAYTPKSAADAVRTANELLRLGHSLDLGLMQINSANLRGLGLSVEDAFQPCPSLRAGAKVLIDGWRAPAPGQDPQPALVRALSHYNTGTPDRGVRNGYVDRVMVSARVVVPAIRLGGPAQAAVLAPEGETQTAAPPPPPSWDVYGRAKAARGGTPAPPVAPAPPAAAAPRDPPPPILLRPVSEEEG